MKRTTINDKISVYIPKPKMKQRPMARLRTLAKKTDRSINYLVVDAILQYVEREEAKG